MGWYRVDSDSLAPSQNLHAPGLMEIHIQGGDKAQVGPVPSLRTVTHSSSSVSLLNQPQQLCQVSFTTRGCSGSNLQKQSIRRQKATVREGVAAGGGSTPSPLIY